MTTHAIHRLIERQAVIAPDAPAVIGPSQVVTYRELNWAANRVARHLIAHGFRRGGHALVCLDQGPELAAVLFGVLKAGGCYTWMDPVSAAVPPGVSVSRTSIDAGMDAAYVSVDVRPPLDETGPSPNLPILTRPGDSACLLTGSSSRTGVLITHETVVSLCGRHLPRVAEWSADPAAFELWVGLIGGAALSVDVRERRAA